ncbi:MAG: phosphoribosyltransferase family protein [candidate division Zixibacteria bacterium]|nr:phosphoribosyltransferase family protein [candidate division Zixibacteria bacterium]
MKSYDYKTRKGIREITWNEFHEICKNLAEQISKTNFDIIVGIARAGLYPATLVAGMLRKEIYPLRVTRRENGHIKYEKPIWIVDASAKVRGKDIIIIDEIADSGETLSIVMERIRAKFAHSVKTAALITHSWANPKPDYFALESDELIIFPWDKSVLVNGEWKLHPEIESALKLQK